MQISKINLFMNYAEWLWRNLSFMYVVISWSSIVILFLYMKW